MFPTFLAERWWNTLVPLYRAALCHRAGAWLPLYQEEDWEYDARVGALAPRLAFVDARRWPSSITTPRRGSAAREAACAIGPRRTA